MGTKRKRLSQRKCLRIKGVRFGTLIHDDEATIVAEQGVVLLQSKTTGKPYAVPAGVHLTAENYNTDVDIIIREITGEVILQAGEDDFYESETYEDDRILAVDDWDEVKRLVGENKIKLLNKNMSKFSTAFGGFALASVCVALYFWDFAYPLVLLGGVALGLIVGVFGGILPLIKLGVGLSGKVIADEFGNYINTQTGATNMNGGMKIPVRGGVE